MPDCLGKTELVTGASRGIGRAAALALARSGAQVLVHYGRGAAEADAVVEEIRAGGGKAEAVGADLSRPSGPHQLAAKVRAIVGGRLDILVANAGISKDATIEDTTLEDFDAQYAVNVRAPLFLVQQLLPILGDGASIIFTSSLAARAAVGNLAAYAATKGAGRDMALGMQALKRLAQPEDIGGAIAFLASAEARWITGDTLRVDGGSKL